MAEDIQSGLRQLLRVSEIDNQIDGLRREREGLGDELGVPQLEKRLKRLAGERKKLEEEARKLRSEVRIQEAECKELQQEAESIRKRLFEGKVKSPKEMDAMDRKAGSLDVRREERETVVIEKMMELDELSARIQRALASEEETSRSLEDRKRQVRERQEEIDGRLAQLESRREPEWKAVSDALKKEYEYRRSRTRGHVVSAMKNGRCTACRVRISIVVANRVERGEGLFSCENCGRLLCWVDDE